MAGRRMFSANIINSDAFMELPPMAQNLYFHLNMRADDDGFVNSPRMVTRLTGATEGDLAMLTERGFLLSFPNGVAAVTHWRVHNLIRRDRYNPTRYQELYSSLSVLPNGEYALSSPAEDPDRTAAADRQPNGNQPATQVRLG